MFKTFVPTTTGTYLFTLLTSNSRNIHYRSITSINQIVHIACDPDKPTSMFSLIISKGILILLAILVLIFNLNIGSNGESRIIFGGSSIIHVHNDNNGNNREIRVLSANTIVLMPLLQVKQTKANYVLLVGLMYQLVKFFRHQTVLM